MYRAEALQQLGKQKKMSAVLFEPMIMNEYMQQEIFCKNLKKIKIGTLIENYYFSGALFSKGKRTILKSQISWKKFKGAVSREKFRI